MRELLLVQSLELRLCHLAVRVRLKRDPTEWSSVRLERGSSVRLEMAPFSELGHDHEVRTTSVRGHTEGAAPSHVACDT